MRTDARTGDRVSKTLRARLTARLPGLPFTKAIALVTLGSFLLTLVPARAVAALAGEKQALRERETSSAGFLLPHSLGRVTGAGAFGGNTLVVEIQDLHCHGEVQRNISRILELLDKTHPLLRVYQEGATGQVDTSWLDAIDDGKLRGDILDSLLDEGRLTGAEHYSFASGKYRLVRGLEDAPLYDANVLRLTRGLADRPLTDALLKDLSVQAAALEARYFSRPNRRLSALAAKYAKGGLPAKEYARLLLKMHKKRGEAASGRFPALSAYLELGEREKNADYAAIGRELQALAAELKRDLPFRDYQALLERTEEFSRLDELPARLASLGLSSRVAAFPRLKEFFEYLGLSRSVNPLTLLREERKLARDLQFGFARSESEREVVFISDYLRRLEDQLNNRITPEDYEYFSDNFERFRFLWAKHAEGESLEKLLPYCRLMDEYYRANIERNRAFFMNAGLEPGTGAGGPPAPEENAAEKAAAMLGSGAKVIVTVTGGFHVPGFTRLLEEKKISYLEITPNV
ncbi:MAG: hypothetical protein ACYC5N_11735, partial [Endomicrobiales bacterium]